MEPLDFTTRVPYREPKVYSAMAGRKPMSKMAQEIAEELLSTPEYRAMLLARANAGILPPQIEVMLWAYAYGKPLEQVDTAAKRRGLKAHTDEELIALHESILSEYKTALDQKLVAQQSLELAIASHQTEEDMPRRRHFADLTPAKFTGDSVLAPGSKRRDN